jgi:hypothetical protein
MASIVGKLNKKGLCNPPKWLPNGIQCQLPLPKGRGLFITPQRRVEH